jgi:hypothetical protein
MTAVDKLAGALWEADRHAAALSDALTEWDVIPVHGLDQLEGDRMLLRLSDQLLFRFTKLQDAIGERLVPATLQRLAEPYESWPMRDRLDRLEKLGYLNVDDWLRWRELRNRLSHEYPDQPELRFATLKAAIVAAHELVAGYRTWKLQLGGATMRAEQAGPR